MGHYKTASVFSKVFLDFVRLVLSTSTLYFNTDPQKKKKKKLKVEIIIKFIPFQPIFKFLPSLRIP